eukprot:scaffold1661_cov251-Pinguiococcus_pyrenoidosus.AAC.48
MPRTRSPYAMIALFEVACRRCFSSTPFAASMPMQHSARRIQSLERNAVSKAKPEPSHAASAHRGLEERSVSRPNRQRTSNASPLQSKARMWEGLGRLAHLSAQQPNEIAFPLSSHGVFLWLSGASTAFSTKMDTCDERNTARHQRLPDQKQLQTGVVQDVLAWQHLGRAEEVSTQKQHRPWTRFTRNPFALTSRSICS